MKIAAIKCQHPLHRGTLATLLENQIRAHLSFPFFPGSEPVIIRSALRMEENICSTNQR
ncbi:hypothetical protein ECDEC6C_0820 [Escherichia coli DEC6C]|nr:hypothetical protein ECDEC6C_0820 [Escherichia coli DEC6C]